jgi:RNA polymerase sigma-70 factor (ECF subfamily)
LSIETPSGPKWYRGTFGLGYGLTVREETTADVLERLQAGDPRAFEELVTAYQHRVFSLAYRMLGSRAEAEEAAQEVFLRIHRALAGFRGEAKLSTWVYTITSRLCLSRLATGHLRMARAREAEDALADLPSPDGDAVERIEREEMERALRRAIAELPEERRIVVVLRDLEGLSYEEIAETLGLTLGAVRSRLHRARMELKDRLEKFFA